MIRENDVTEKAQALAAPEISEWMGHTPNETTYELVMFSDDGVSIQDINLDREEFVALKSHLAQLRGHTPTAPAGEAKRPRSGSVKAKVLDDRRRACKREFNWFLESCTDLGEMYLMSNVLNDWNGNRCELGEAFEMNLSSPDSCYVKVHEDYKEQVQEFAESLMKNGIAADGGNHVS